MQLCPLAPKIPAVIPLIAFSWCASLNTATGLFPPSSKLTSDKFSAEFLMIWRAVSGPPVNAIFSTRLCDVRALPQGSPKPEITFTTPFGIPVSWINFANSNIVAGANSEHLITTVLPIANAGASFVAVKNICEFHGTIAAITPIGILVVIAWMFGLSIGRTVPSTLSARPA